MLKPGNLLWEGMQLGYQAALILSIGYACLGMLIAEIAGVGLGFPLWIYIIASPFIFVAAGMLGIALAILLAEFTGLILGILARLLNKRISRFAFVAVCLGVCISLAITLYVIIRTHMAFSIKDFSSGDRFIGIYATYPFWLGIPSVIYILAGGWVSWKLYDKEPILKAPPAA